MNALETLHAARALWDKQNDQLSLEDCTPVGIDGAASRPSVSTLSPGLGAPVSPGCSTDPASTNGSSLPPDGAVPFPESEERDAGLSNPTATAAEPVRVGAAVAGGDFTC